MGLKAILLKPYQRYRFLKYFFKYRRPIGIKNSLWCLTHGFFPTQFILFNLKENDPSLYVTDFEENFRISQINRNTEVLNNKLVFPEILGNFFKSPPIFSLLFSGKFIPFHTDSGFDEAAALEYLGNVGALILKPFDGDGGVGIVKLSFKSENVFLWNGVEISIEELKQKFSQLNGYMVSGFVNQAAYSNAIFNGSVNTIRLLTLIDPKTQMPFIGAAAHRIGNAKSAPVDNCAMGGFTAAIDIESGVLGAATSTKFQSAMPPCYTVHPDSGAAIEGVIIPQWSRLCKEITALHTRLNFISYIGWDIVAGADGCFYILEGNDGADLKLHQAHAPLLRNPAVKAFYLFHRAIK